MRAGRALALLAVAAGWRSACARRRPDRFNRRVHTLHAVPADAGTTLAHFWLGSLLARYGTDAQMDDWYRMTHGGPALSATDTEGGDDAA